MRGLVHFSALHENKSSICIEGDKKENFLVLDQSQPLLRKFLQVKDGENHSFHQPTIAEFLRFHEKDRIWSRV